MLDYLAGTPRRLDFPFVPSPSGGGLVLLQGEGIGNALMVMGGYTPDLVSADKRHATAMITANGALQSVFGYPNEESYWNDPRGDLGHGVYEIVGSEWFSNIERYNERTFGTKRISPFPEPEVRHFFVGSKDVACQVLATNIEVEVFAETPFQDVLADAYTHLL